MLLGEKEVGIPEKVQIITDTKYHLKAVIVYKGREGNSMHWIMLIHDADSYFRYDAG